MIVKHSNAPGIECFEPLTGCVNEILVDLSGPFIGAHSGEHLSIISVEAIVLGDDHNLTVRFHICLRLDRLDQARPRLTLRPADFDDELDGGIWDINAMSPRYNAEYKDRFAVNACLTALLLKQRKDLITTLKIAAM